MIYLWLLLATAAAPLTHLFDRRISFYKNLWALIPAIAITAAYFLVWDVIFTHWGVWGFNSQYLIGVFIGNLPLEEILFFFVIPLACLFIYDATKYYVPGAIGSEWARTVTWILAIGFSILGLLSWGRAYTSVTSLGAATLLWLQVGAIKGRYLGRFYFAYLVCLLPFFIVNGILTGSFLPEPIVWYNDAENLGLRMGTIPVEDSIYMLLMLLSTTTIYEFLKSRVALQSRL